MKKICIVKYSMGAVDGAERVAINLANAFCSRYEVHAVSICSDTGRLFYPLSEQVHFKNLLQEKARIRKVFLPGTRLLRRYLNENQIDVAIGIAASTNSFLIFGGGRAKTVFCEHLNIGSPYCNDFGQRAGRFLGAHFADKVITLTEQDKDEYLSKYHIPPARADFIYNWVEDSLLERNPEYRADSRKIITVGRITQQKGYDLLVRIAEKVFPRFPAWQWHIYGGGDPPETQRLENEIRQRGLQDFVVLKGQDPELYRRYGEYGIYAMTSYYEGLPMVLLEARANNLPVISFDCRTGPREIVADGQNGILVPAFDVDLYAEKLCALMENGEQRKRFSAHARDHIDKFGKEQVLKKWCELIDNLN
ncbi:MAG: glycosyltransferase family 4 protein [Clostridiales bacterium]|nr:glycosyltransferase family 4 protein [Clostridiales bacterium]